jgi:hypothetical protein
MRTDIAWSTAERIVVRGLARAGGLVGDLVEEREWPIAREVWRYTEEEASAHVRPV